MVELLSELVQIPSVNPLQAGPKAQTPGEMALASAPAAKATALGANVVLDEVLPGRPNLYATFAGTSDTVIGIDVHLDTVGVEHMTDPPFDGRVESGAPTGAAVDTKPTFAIVLAVIEAMQQAGVALVPTVHLIGTVGEEVGGFQGAVAFHRWVAAEGISIDSLIVAEPTMCAPVHGHKGALGLDVTVTGVAAHSSKPHLGVDAIAGAARAIAAPRTRARPLAGRPSDDTRWHWHRERHSSQGWSCVEHHR
ncbi:MAG: M20/M25/M40 family metallo-hydrolase [Acidimicrobiales bacterium]